MSYIGNIPADKYQTLEKQSFSVSATTGYTLSYSVSSPQDIALYINNVRQNPNSSYTVSNTALTLSSATSSGDVMYAVFLGKSVGTIGVPVNGVGTSQIVDNAVTSAKLASGLALGKIGQVTSNIFDLNTSITSTSLVELNSSFRLTLTPSAASSKFLFQFQFTHFSLAANNGFFAHVYKSVGGGAYSDASGKLSSYTGYENSSNYSFSSMSYLDSPSTTSTVIYTPYVSVSSSEVRFGDNAKGFATLMEVLA